MSVPFLTDKFGPSAAIAVEIAWGANLAALASTWVWSDVTADVRFSSGINVKNGRGDEAATTQPASCGFTLDNTTGAYSLGGQSPNWPNVRQNTPVRVRVDIGAGWRTLFKGFADAWAPSWDQSAKVATVQLTASGILRRLQQHSAPVISALRRRLSREANVVAYWPFEEGSDSQEGMSAFAGHPSMTVTAGAISFGADATSFAATKQIATIKAGGASGTVPSYALTPECQIRALMSFTDDGLTDQSAIFRVLFGSTTLSRMDVIYSTGGSLTFRGYSTASSGAMTMVINSGPWNLGGGPPSTGVNGQALRMFMELAQVGGDVAWKIGMQTVVSSGGKFANGTLAGATLGIVQRVDIGPGTANAIGSLGIGHVVVQNDITSIFDDYKDLTSFAGDSAFSRFVRLCTENGISRIGYGDGVAGSSLTQNDLMGPQGEAALLSLLRAAESVNDGIIFDGSEDADLVFRLRQARENSASVLTLPVTALAAPLMPSYDDQARINKMEATRQDGGSYTAEDVTGPLGTAAVGIYDASKALALQSDDSLPDHARWAVAKGTYEGYRHPSLELNLAATPEHASAWLTVGTPGRRINVTDVTTVAPQYPTSTIELEVQGSQQTLTPKSWHVTVNCAPFDPWRVFRIADEIGDANGFNGRLETDGSTLVSAAALGATSLSVATATGPLWTTAADDFPLTVLAGGIVLTVTNITGATSPQTFTVTAISKALPSGAPVRVNQSAVLAL